MGKAKAKAKKKTTGARAKRDRRRKLATEAPTSAEEQLASVPGLDALQDVPAFDDLPVDEAQQAAFDDFCVHAEETEQMQLGAVVRLDRGFPLVATATDTFRAEHAVDLPSRAARTRSCCLPWATVWRYAALPGTIWA